MNTTANTEKNICSICHENGSSSNNYGSIVLLSLIIRILYFLIIWKAIPMQKMILNLKEILSLRRDHFTAGICTFHFKEYIEQIICLCHGLFKLF